MGTIGFPSRPGAPAANEAPRLNESQERALDLARDVAITAAAGSGKTTVLVERFVRTLESGGFRPERIVAITFTEEAAAQMRARIREAVEARRRDSETETTGEENPWNRALRFLSLAKITTIHGFCLSLLREYPLDAGLDPEFRLLGPGEQELFLDARVLEALDGFSRDSHPGLAALLDYVGRSALGSTLRQMIRRRNYLGGFSPGDLPVERLEAAYRAETAVAALRLPAWDRLREALRSLPPRLVRDTSSCARRCRRQISLFQRRESGMSDEEFLADFEESLSIRVSPSRDWKASGRYQSLKEIWDELRKGLRKHPLRLPPVPPRQDKHFRRAVDSLARLYADTLDFHQTAKKRLGVLDFEDLLDLARGLVQKPSVREAVRRRYRHFLVDEFQDTNHVQWEILRPLLGDETNFFAVGDAKQSIYRFRDADVAIFEEVQRWIARRGQVQEMPENYRSLPELVRFNNRIFSGLFQKSLPYEAAHQEMRPLRRADSGDEGRVEALFFDPEAEVSEPALTAARIRRLLDEEGRRASEIAVLLRARTRLKDYERALREAEIPFHTAGGVGFFQQQEVMDLLNPIRFLLDPSDDIALLGALRGPLFNFSDEELFAFSQLEGDSLWEKLRQAGAAGTPPPHWKFALQALTGWRQNAPREPVAAFLRRLLRETGMAAALSRSLRWRQSLSNIEKLLETAHEFERLERRGLRRFIQYVDGLERSDASEPEGQPLGLAEEQVRIHTIHGAKGLQFPVVVLPELGVPLSSAPSDRFVLETLRHDGVARGFPGFKIRDPDDGYRELSHPVFRMVRKLDEYRRVAEEKRLLYVACTRAEDHLILIGRGGEAPSAARWLADLGADRHRPGRDEVDRLLERASDTAQSRRGRGAPQLEDPSDASWTAVRPPKTTAAPKKTDWTPTEIALWRNCPRKFQLSRIDGWSEEHPLSLEPHGGESALVGSAVHDIFEKEPDLRREAAVRRRIEIWLDRLAVAVPTVPREAMRSRLESHVRAFAESALYLRMAEATKLHREKPFHVRSGRFLIKGVIDRLFEGTDGSWVVVDFKTNEIPAERVSEAVADLGYDLQVEIYLWAVSKILRTEQIEGALFFSHTSTTHRVPWNPEAASRCRNIVESLPAAVPADLTKTTNSQHCARCGFLESGLCDGALPPRIGE